MLIIGKREVKKRVSEYGSVIEETVSDDSCWKRFQQEKEGEREEENTCDTSILRPSLGCMPRIIWNEKRIQQLAGAISRVDPFSPIIIEWCNEIIELFTEIIELREER